MSFPVAGLELRHAYSSYLAPAVIANDDSEMTVHYAVYVNRAWPLAFVWTPGRVMRWPVEAVPQTCRLE